MCRCCVNKRIFLSLPKFLNTMSKVTSLHHIIINTKERKMTIAAENAEAMYRFITTIIKRNNCVLYRIGGIENHIHILIDLSPQVSLSHLVWDIKRSSSDWAKRSGFFPLFAGWGKEYGAFSISPTHKEAVSHYISTQREHHAVVSFDDEYKRIILRYGMPWTDNTLT